MVSGSLVGKDIVVTGASSGIGASIAECLLGEGAQVFGLCRRVDQLPVGVVPIRCDLSQPQEVRAAFAQIKEITDSIYGLVNNAGLALLERVSDGSPERFAEMWQVNVQGLLLATQRALPMFPVQGGRIVNISSMSGHRVPPSGGFYSPTKFAVRAISESLRLELASDGLPHQVAMVSPGFVDTPLLDRYFAGREEELIAMRESTSMLQPSDVAQAVSLIFSAPAGVQIGDIQLRPAGQKI